MSNFEYDKLYDELSSLEVEYNIHYSNSPTNKVGSDVSTSLPKIAHEYPMLSLDKTKKLVKNAEKPMALATIYKKDKTKIVGDRTERKKIGF
jgi:NAD-dependent DNA ligase